MKILLIGEFSGVHWTLAEGLRKLGHQVVLASNGDGPRNFPRDVDFIAQYNAKSKTLKQKLFNAKQVWTKMRGFDVVQWINPWVLDSTLKDQQFLYSMLKKANGTFVLGAFGADAVYIDYCLRGTPEYSIYDEFVGKILPKNIFPHEAGWQNPKNVAWNTKMAEESAGIIACSPEYYKAYSQSDWGAKTHFIPLPLDLSQIGSKVPRLNNSPLKIGMVHQPGREAVKGWEQMTAVLRMLKDKMGDKIEVDVAPSMSYVDYVAWLGQKDIFMDQALSFGPGIAALTAMAMGIPSFSGGEESYYSLLNEPTLRPILNYRPSEEGRLVLEMEALYEVTAYESCSAAGKAMVQNYHSVDQVAKRYEAMFLTLAK